MKIKYLVATLILCLCLTACQSTALDSSGNPINRSLLIDTGIKLGGNLPFLPIPLPEFDLGFRLNFRRPTPQEEIDLNLSKVGKWRGMEPPKPAPPLSSPAPFPATPKKEDK